VTFRFLPTSRLFSGQTLEVRYKAKVKQGIINGTGDEFGITLLVFGAVAELTKFLIGECLTGKINKSEKEIKFRFINEIMVKSYLGASNFKRAG